jgi:hypothetical protein
VCKIPRVVIVAPADKHLELRKALSSLDYDIAATVASVADAVGVKADAAIAWEPDTGTVEALRAVGFKTVAVGGTSEGADMTLATDDVTSLRTRIWELFRAV